MVLYHQAIAKIRRRIKRVLRGKAYSNLALLPPPAKTLISSKEPMLMEIVPTKKNTVVIGQNWLINFKDNRFSEHGEDGIIAKIFTIMPPENKWVCEFGAHDPEIISNTWRLIHQEGWSAVLIEADDFYYNKLKNYYQATSAVHCVHTKVSYEGNEALDVILHDTPVPKNLDFMVIDIDGNDYHVWEAINNYRAKVVMIEFNASIPVDVSFVQPRDLSVNQGTSLKAMTELAATKGYKLVAVTSWNAFFIQEQYFHLFFQHDPQLEDMYVYPAKHPISMRPFQLYDGTICIAPWNEMLWHRVDLQKEDYQVLPTSLRVFSPELAFQPYIFEKTGEKTLLEPENNQYLAEIAQMPANKLAKFAKNYSSRYGEDGMIEKLIQSIPMENQTVVEIGAADGKNIVSRHLLTRCHWQGFIFEQDKTLIPSIKANLANFYQLEVCDTPYTLTGNRSLEELFKQANISKELDILILNVFGMEYFVWDSITKYSPKIVIAQFNPTIPNDIKFIQANDPSVHQGCSLRALCDLAHYKNYALVGVSLEKAFFVQRKYFYRLFESFAFQAADLDEMFMPIQMKWFQLYDGTIAIRGLNRLFWHGIRIDEEKLQVIPKALRAFHQFANKDTKKFFYRVK